MLTRLKLSKTLITLMLGLFTSIPQALAQERSPWQLNMFQGVTPLSNDMYDLHNIAMLVCCGIGIVVFGVMIYSLIYHRKARGFQAATFHHNTRLEIIWSVIPFLILIGLAIPATRILIRLNDTSESAVTIKVVGSQWRWQYQYMDQGISYFSNLATPYDQIHNTAQKSPWYLLEVDKPLVLPVNKKIRFLVTSTDVIHSWWVPELGIKRDAMPGFMYEAWAVIEKPGVYRGQCAELCGINHAFMPIVVHAVSDEEFNQWVSQQPKVNDKYNATNAVTNAPKDLTYAELIKQGKTKYEQICAACHKSDGNGIPPMFPALKGSSVATGHPISRHIDIILNGIPGSAMQAYKDQLTDEEIAAIVTYERNAWDNNTDDVVQASAVAQVRQANHQQPKMVNKVNIGGLR